MKIITAKGGKSQTYLSFVMSTSEEKSFLHVGLTIYVVNNDVRIVITISGRIGFFPNKESLQCFIY